MWMRQDCTGRGWQAKVYISKEGKLLPSNKVEKDRLTRVTGSGHMKLKPVLVHYSENTKTLKTTAKGPLPVMWKSNAKAWVTQAVFQVALTPFSPKGREMLLGEGCPTHSFATQHCSRPPPICGRFSPQCQSSASVTEHYFAHPVYGPGGYSNFEEMFMSHFSSDSESGTTLGQFWKDCHMYKM